MQSSWLHPESWNWTLIKATWRDTKQNLYHGTELYHAKKNNVKLRQYSTARKVIRRRGWNTEAHVKPTSGHTILIPHMLLGANIGCVWFRWQAKSFPRVFSNVDSVLMAMGFLWVKLNIHPQKGPPFGRVIWLRWGYPFGFWKLPPVPTSHLCNLFLSQDF